MISPEPSHFSAISRSSSLSNLRAAATNIYAGHERPIFLWTNLRSISEHVQPNTSQKASTLLGSSLTGTPTVLSANGMICIGTSSGKTWVFDFKQTLKCVCGGRSVTALALSHDHTYLACGHAHGHIFLYDLSNPDVPARTVLPTSLVNVASGRQEGHLLGTRIVSIDFIAGRHTAVVSSDDSGLSFYHSLGKVLFVAANDTLRILGRYPEDDPGEHIRDAKPAGLAPHHPAASRRRRERRMNTTLAMAPLPLGTGPSPTDAYNVVALLTPMKLVIVGLKPSPKTWYRRHRDEEDGKGNRSRWRGTLAWFPSMLTSESEKHTPASSRLWKRAPKEEPRFSLPVLAYSWGPTLRSIEIEVGSLVFRELISWEAGDDILALQWLNVNQVLVATTEELVVYDIRMRKPVERSRFDVSSLVSPTLEHTVNGGYTYSHAVGDVAHSTHHGIQVGTLLTWADRILAFVQGGDFISAIELTRTFYLGEAPGNRNGLPDDPDELREVVGTKLRELMNASAAYAFSEDRMRDSTHLTSDGRGVDRTTLFEELVSACTRACIALDNFDFLFEDLFQYYEESGITRIYLLQLEAFILDGQVRYVPPRITQRLVALHDEDSRPDLAERVIWHIAPECLDVSQALVLCQRHHLYDALIYVFTRAVQDYVSPAVELLALVRRVQQYRRYRKEATEGEHVDPSEIAAQDDGIEPILINAYKIYPYLSDTLSGLTYPSEEPIEEPEASRAKQGVYSFIFDGRSRIWPEGEGGELILTAEEEGGAEPTYPYLRLLLRFDTEAFLHSLDIAFEDAYLNDEPQGISRLLIVKVLLEILSTPDLSPSDITFINIFIARNVPKYPQFIRMPPSELESILVALAKDPDESTREDRQLAAEYLLSAYTPHQTERVLSMLEKAGFYRILRSWHMQERQWGPLLMAHVRDPELSTPDLFKGSEVVLARAFRANKKTCPPELLQDVKLALPTFLLSEVSATALLLDKHLPQLHQHAVDLLDTDEGKFVYLQYLLGPPPADDDMREHSRPGPPTTKLSKELCSLYVELQCRLHPTDTIAALAYLPEDFLDWTETLWTCEDNDVFDAVVWGYDRQGQPDVALNKAAEFDKRLGIQVVDTLSGPNLDEERLFAAVEGMESVARVAVAVCVAHSNPRSNANPVPEDLWFQLLSSQITSVQIVAGALQHLPSTDGAAAAALDRLRALVQQTFSSLMTMAPSTAVSFPRLFKRLVESPKPVTSGGGAMAYTEFRVILTGMLDTYRSEGDMLAIAKHLVDRDVFETIEELCKAREKGWKASRGVCAGCRKPLVDHANCKNGEGDAGDGTPEQLVVSRTGVVYHRRADCLPSTLDVSLP
ncbi:hypothetical protein PUNSTDRAFT_62414 [Punctularia strigosozonata HHB-11173 SS5]|uniref:uncharacterized protein n=1 Tax=Punctularia strigosozonata (strain HHB-11173) TaxID=741275 RepID=UPI000441753D|nr:uncharacterized protein PUNSTDRAFT_62414 [Punctularia strigosozonata HHB-11173 SS5]EIN11934.1 hypothetical protein PUNSTDRAFT_62414 [Punctularia strigosozonata HHB-11173 SS5]